MRELELADGTVLEFPDETTDEVMANAGRRYMKQKTGGASTIQESPAGQFMTGLATGFGEQVAALPEMIGTTLTNPMQAYEQYIKAPAMEQFGKAKEAWEAGRPIEAAARGVTGAVPIVGPGLAAAGEQLGTAIGTGEPEQYGRATAAVAPYLAAGIPRPRVPEIGMAPTVLETAPGAVGSTARVLVRTPMSQSLGRRALQQREVPLKARIGEVSEQLAPGELPTPTQLGEAVVSTAEEARTAGPKLRGEQAMAPYPELPDVGKQLKAKIELGRKAAKAGTQAEWKPLIRDIESAGIIPDIAQIQEAGTQLLKLPQAARDFLATKLTRSEMALLEKAAAIGEDTAMTAELKKWMPGEGAASPAEAAKFQDLLAGLGEAPEPPSWTAVQNARSAVAELKRSSWAKSPEGNLNTATLTELDNALVGALRDPLPVELQTRFDTARAATRAYHDIYGTGLVKTILNQKTAPSQIVSRYRNLPVETARKVRMALPQSDALFLDQAVVRSIFDQATKKGVLDPNVLNNLVNNPRMAGLIAPEMLSQLQATAQGLTKLTSKGTAYQNFLNRLASTDYFENIIPNIMEAQGKGRVELVASTRNLNRLLKSNPQLKQQVLRSGFEYLVEKSREQGFTGGERLAELITQKLPKFETLGASPEHLAELSKLAKELKPQNLLRVMRISQESAHFHTFWLVSGATAGVFSFLTGSAPMGIATAASVMAAERALVSILLRPQGVSALRTLLASPASAGGLRALQTLGVISQGTSQYPTPPEVSEAVQ